MSYYTTPAIFTRGFFYSYKNKKCKIYNYKDKKSHYKDFFLSLSIDNSYIILPIIFTMSFINEHIVVKIYTVLILLLIIQNLCYKLFPHKIFSKIQLIKEELLYFYRFPKWKEIEIKLENQKTISFDINYYFKFKLNIENKYKKNIESIEYYFKNDEGKTLNYKYNTKKRLKIKFDKPITSTITFRWRGKKVSNIRKYK